MDYYGESHGWPHVISSYGQFDVAGFAKSAAHWCVLCCTCSASVLHIGAPEVVLMVLSVQSIGVLWFLLVKLIRYDHCM